MTTESQYIAPRLAGFGPKLAWRVRREIFINLMDELQPAPKWQVLDAGVTADRTSDSNFFEKLYPYPESITAIGLEDASFLEVDHPGIRFVRANACNLPFADNTFDLAFCSAVIEHVGSRKNQLQLIRELTRVSRMAVITTPNRYFPLEFHTLTPLIHWLHPRIFRGFLSLTGRSFFAEESNLNLLSEKDMDRMIGSLGLRARKKHHRLIKIKSNLVYYVEADYDL